MLAQKIITYEEQIAVLLDEHFQLEFSMFLEIQSDNSSSLGNDNPKAWEDH